ncbi:unnamed protein product [Brassica rapa]|nr:unnamed protein product [Brassica napus]CAG7862382.1 unnamed protein product [Brassica rapa]
MAMKFVRSTGNLEFYGSKSKEIYQCRWLKILLATVVKLISLLDKIVTGAQMGVISLIMREIDCLMEYYIEG